jgi:hypothetical protein
MIHKLTKIGIVLFTTVAGGAVGYFVFLFLSLSLLVIYGDDGQGGHPSESLKNSLFFGTLGIFPICGFVIGLKITKNMFNAKLLK